ncbi:MAG TPA: prolyl oligopeptidase family serine peptidase [Candidatus Aquilonibacter sp.]|jgi:hypothetical protein|nr:prolyl oligopeptidase family serine peptidase [Candidatus Aquilonibacter sp.]
MKQQSFGRTTRLNCDLATHVGAALRTLAVVLMAAALCGSASVCGSEKDINDPLFTIKDSIEMSRIIDTALSTTIELREKQPPGVPIYSSDGEYFLLVTQRGVLSTNRLEGTIWLFNRKSVHDHVRGTRSAEVVPQKLLSVSSTSNTPVIEDVRWIGPKEIAFLAKDGSPYQQLFVADVEKKTVLALTKRDCYVTGYEIRGDVTVYTTLAEEKVHDTLRPDAFSVGSRSAIGLLYREPPAIQDIEESYLLKRPSYLHVRVGQREVPIRSQRNGEPLQVFVPSISLSPDARLLITVAPVREVPGIWEQYEPRFQHFRLKAGYFQTQDLMTLESFWRPEQYVVVNLETGFASPLLDAPAARDLGYGGVPTKAFWLADNRRVVLSNTYLPLLPSIGPKEKGWILASPTFALVDATTREVQACVDFKHLPGGGTYDRIENISWRPAEDELVVRYRSNDLVLRREAFVFRSNEWVRSSGQSESGQASEDETELTVEEDLNRPPVLAAASQHGKVASTLWDPNPQLNEINLGKAEIYHWRDVSGKRWSGILVLPPHYDRGRRYPMVIQTHGYDPDSFFADGFATTGSGGRALAAKGIIILQMGDSFPDLGRPREAPDQLLAFASAVDILATQGMVDRSRIGIIGFSRTCYHVLYALTHSAKLFRAAAITDGVNFGYVEYVLVSAGDRYQAEAESINGGSPFGRDLMEWVRGAPNFRLSRVKAPVLISAYLPGALLSQWEIYSGLRSLKKPADMLWWSQQNTPHVLVQPAQRYASQQSAVDWFDFWLNGQEDPDPSKADQYERWQSLRKGDAETRR